MTNCYQDPEYLRHNQYRDSANLEARAALHRRFSTGKLDWFDWVWQKLALQPGEQRVLECGCGPGGLWAYNRARLPANCSVVLTDLSAGMVAEAREILGDLPRFRFETADIQQLPFPDNSFDVVVANHMLYHVPHLDQALAEVKRVLRSDENSSRPNARLVCATNGDNHMRELPELAQAHNFPLHFRSQQLAFRLENGEALLRPFFSQIERHDYDSNLAVTEVAPLLAYALSYGEARQQITPDQLDLLRQHVASVIADQGYFHITKATGLFVASV